MIYGSSPSGSLSFNELRDEPMAVLLYDINGGFFQTSRWATSQAGIEQEIRERARKNLKHILDWN